VSAAVAAILEGMPEPGDLRMHQVGGRCVITAGSVVLFDFDEADIGMRNLALVSLRSLGFRGRAVAAVLGLTEAYVSTLWSAARRDGSAAVLSGQLRRGKPGTVTPEQGEQARAWRAEGASDAEIGRRLGVAHTTIGRGLGKRQETAAAAQAWVAGPLPDADGAAAVRPAAGPGAGTSSGRRRRTGAGGRGGRAGEGWRRAGQLAVCGGDAAACVLRPDGCGRAAAGGRGS
jgi:hypothetical protein